MGNNVERGTGGQIGWLSFGDCVGEVAQRPYLCTMFLRAGVLVLCTQVYLVKGFEISSLIQVQVF